MSRRSTSTRIDPLMEQASEALIQADYFRAERLAIEAMALARSCSAFERMARICLPLQEARRQRTAMAFDIAAGEVATGTRRSSRPRGGSKAGRRAAGVASPAAAATKPAATAVAMHARIVDRPIAEAPLATAGCWLVQPPNVAADARRLHLAALERATPAVILCREPLARSGFCPIVAVGALVIRTYVAPPADPAQPTLVWFAAALEALGDAAMADAEQEPDVVRRIDALMARLDAIPEHEKLHQALARACAAAARA